MFEGDDALKKVQVLSGGEKSRVMLGKLLVTPVNLLLLEWRPTNHLDMDSTDALLGAIDNFDGAVVLVTHNEMFLHALAERLIVFDKGYPTEFEGDYQRFLDHEGWLAEAEDARKEPKETDTAKSDAKLNKKELRRMRSQIISERSKVLAPLKTKIKKVEDAIEKSEQELGRMNASMEKAVQKNDGLTITELAQSIHFCQKTIDRLFNELADLTESCEVQEAVFEERLQELSE